MKLLGIIISLSFIAKNSQAIKELDAATQYPVVLIHGLLGYSGELHSWARYWGDLPTFLRDHGAVVYEASLPQAHGIEDRGEQLAYQLDLWGHEKYHLIGHSQGGLDARYVLEIYPDMVASLTTIGTPHRGSKVADAISNLMNRSGAARFFLGILGDTLGYTISLLSGNFHHLQSFHKAVASLTTIALERFNERYSIGIGGDSCRGGEHRYRGKPLFSWGSYGVLPGSDSDILSYILQKTSNIFGQQERNDGLVAVCSMKFGRWLGAVPGGHHLIPVGGVVSSPPQGLEDWSRQMLLEHVVKLKVSGL